IAAHARQLTPHPVLWEQPIVLDFLPAFEQWLRGDLPAMIRSAEAIGGHSSRHAKRGAVLPVAARGLAPPGGPFGHGGDRDANDREGDRALIAYFRGDRRAVAVHAAAAERNYGNQLTLIVWLWMQTDPHEAERYFHEWSRWPDDGHTPSPHSAWADS